MHNLLEKLRIARPDLTQKLEASFIESPHEFELDMARVAIPLKQVSQLIEFVADASLPPFIRNAAMKRKLSFIGGRLCAESALKRIGFPNAIVARHDSGAPIWPDGVVGSITHTDQFAYAVACRAINAVSLGIDSENIFSDATLKDVRQLCCTTNENINLFKSTNNNLVGTIIFSAKESLYKSIHSHINRFVDFSEIELTSIDWYLSRVHMQPVKEGDLNPVVSQCHAYFCISNNSVHTSVQMSPPPRTLIMN